MIGKLKAGFPFLICDSLPAMPHPKSVTGDIVGFDLSPVLMFWQLDGSPEVIVGFHISVRNSVPLLGSGSSSF